MKRTKSMVYNPTEEARELVLYTENTSVIMTPVVETLRRHYKRGDYNTEKAVDAWYNAATRGSNLYNKEFGYSFSVQDRFTAAVELEESLRYLVEEG